MAYFFAYDSEKHRDDYFELSVEYFTYVINKSIKSGYEKEKIDSTVEEYARKMVEANFGRTLSSLNPSEGVLYILKVDGAIAGMGALRKLKDNVGEIKRMYVRPNYRGRGYGKKMLEKLLDKAYELGYSIVRLDTAKYLETAIHIYKSAGFTEIKKYPGTMSEGPGYLYMEKKL